MKIFCNDVINKHFSVNEFFTYKFNPLSVNFRREFLTRLQFLFYFPSGRVMNYYYSETFLEFMYNRIVLHLFRRICILVLSRCETT